MDILEQVTKRLEELKAERDRVRADLIRQAEAQIANELKPFDAAIGELEKLLPKAEPAGATEETAG